MQAEPQWSSCKGAVVTTDDASISVEDGGVRYTLLAEKGLRVFWDTKNKAFIVERLGEAGKRRESAPEVVVTELPKAAFAVGDRVRLRTGGFDMEVVAVDGDRVRCCWDEPRRDGMIGSIDCRKTFEASELARVADSLTPEEFARQMRGLFPASGHDEEAAHSCADALMCGLLRSLGYGEGADIFEAADKWYA